MTTKERIAVFAAGIYFALLVVVAWEIVRARYLGNVARALAEIQAIVAIKRGRTPSPAELSAMHAELEVITREAAEGDRS